MKFSQALSLGSLLMALSAAAGCIGTRTVWNTSKANLATVSVSGMVSAINAGAVDISADYKGEKGNEHLGVTP